MEKFTFGSLRMMGKLRASGNANRNEHKKKKKNYHMNPTAIDKWIERKENDGENSNIFLSFCWIKNWYEIDFENFHQITKSSNGRLI